MHRILASDLHIADVAVPAEGNVKIQRLLERYGRKWGEDSKGIISKEQFEELGQALEGQSITISPGGTAANMLTTMGKLMGKDLTTEFIGITGDGIYSSMIRHSLEEGRVNLLHPNSPAGISPITAVSYAILFPNGKRAALTYPGNAREILTSDAITEDMVKRNDIVLVQGSLWQKLDESFAGKLLNLRWEFDKELWLTMPTEEGFGKAKASFFQELIASADVVLSNEKEMKNTYNVDNIEEAVKRLQTDFGKSKTVKKNEGKTVRHEPVALITRSEKGAIIVTPDHIEYIDALPVPVVNKLGAGDAAFAGFAVGQLLGLPHKTSAQVAMVLGAENVRLKSTRIPDPAAALTSASPYLANDVFSRIGTSERVHEP